MRHRKSCRKDVLDQLVFLGTLKIFNVAISCVPEISYLHFCAMPWCFSLPAIVSICVYFDGDTGRWCLFVSFTNFHQDHLVFLIFHPNWQFFFEVWYIGISTQISTFLLRKHCYMKPNSLLKTCYYKNNRGPNISHMKVSFM